VRITFQNSSADSFGAIYPTLQYEVYRRIDPLPNGVPERFWIMLATKEESEARLPRLSPMAAGWDYLGSAPAHRGSEYSLVIPTLADSTIISGMHWSIFFVRAASSDPGIYGDSAPDSGFSLDNLAPGAPQNLLFTAPGFLSWDEASEADFDHFSAYGSASAVFNGTAEVIETTIATTVDVQLDSYPYYYVTTTDFSGNEGLPSTILNTVGVTRELIPKSYDLSQNWPNPFTSSTTMQLDLPEEGNVRVEVFDVRGRLVTSLVEGELPAGRHAILWTSKDSRGQRASPGIYFYRVVTDRFNKTRKAILVNQ
jgi:hypothetical protein